VRIYSLTHMNTKLHIWVCSYPFSYQKKWYEKHEVFLRLSIHCAFVRTAESGQIRKVTMSEFVHFPQVSYLLEQNTRAVICTNTLPNTHGLIKSIYLIHISFFN